MAGQAFPGIMCGDVVGRNDLLRNSVSIAVIHHGAVIVNTTGVFFFSSRRRHTRLQGDWSSDVCSSDLRVLQVAGLAELQPWSIRGLAPRIITRMAIADSAGPWALGKNFHNENLIAGRTDRKSVV